MSDKNTTIDRAAPGAELKAVLAKGLPGQWYAMIASRWVADVPVGVTRLGRKLVIWRDGDGVAHVQADYCPHRGARLSQGHVIDGYVTCPYHGIQMNGEGVIVRVPAMPGCALEGMKGVRTYPTREIAGCIFAYIGETEEEAPVEFGVPTELGGGEWGTMLCTATWKGSYLLALDNLVDPMHGSFLHANSYTLAYGAKEDVMELNKTDKGFTIARVNQKGVNFDWTEYVNDGADFVRLDIPYPKSAGPGGVFRIIGFVTPIDEKSCQVFFWRCRKVEGWQRNLWRFMYRNRLEERHWNVLEQDRIVIEQMGEIDSEMLYQHDIGLTHLRRLLQRRAKAYLKARDQVATAAE